MRARVGKVRAARKAPSFQMLNSQEDHQSRGEGPWWMMKSQKVSSSRWIVLPSERVVRRPNGESFERTDNSRTQMMATTKLRGAIHCLW
jgi:hypothetical protein